MPVFEYNGLDVKGKAVSGIIDADSALAARQKLRGSRLFPTHIKELYDRVTAKDSPRARRFRLFSRVKASEVAMMTRQLATLITAGFPLVSALDTLVTQTKSHAFKKVLAQVKDAVVEGNSFAAALSIHPGVFSSIFVNMVRAGESSGTLDIILSRLAEITEKQQALNSRIRTALTYPIFMSVIGILVLFVLMTYIVPSMTAIFSEMNQMLPAPTRFLIHTSDFMKGYWWTLLLAAGAVWAALRTVKKTARGHRVLDLIKIRSPGVGPLLRKMAVARFSRTLGSLLENGVPMLSALEILRSIAGNIVIAESVDEAAREVSKGSGLGQALSNSEAFPYLAVQMILVGEQSGELESMLTRMADVFENEVESTVMSLTALLEPLMILSMAVIVGFVVVAICLPIFEMNQLVM